MSDINKGLRGRLAQRIDYVGDYPDDAPLFIRLGDGRALLIAIDQLNELGEGHDRLQENYARLLDQRDALVARIDAELAANAILRRELACYRGEPPAPTRDGGGAE